MIPLRTSNDGEMKGFPGHFILSQKELIPPNLVDREQKLIIRPVAR
jgi:hypothetical protein